MLIVMERKVVERATHSTSGVPATGPGQHELPAARKDLPLSRFPLRGKAGAGGFPPRRWHAARQQKALAPIDAAAPPARGVSNRCAETPLAHPPDGHQRGRVVMVGLDLRDQEKKFKDGRHVGLDFYDLLIEAFTDVPVSNALRPSDAPLGERPRRVGADSC